MKKITLFSILFLFLISSLSYAETIEVSTFEELKEAITNSETEIDIEEDFSFNESLKISGDLVINGNGHTIERDASYLKGLFSITSSGNLEINDLTIDGGASNWAMDYDNRYYTGANNTGYIRVPTINTTGDLLATESLITNAGNLKLNDMTITNNWCSVTGSVLKGTGSVSIIDSNFMHNGSQKNGACFYLTGGTLNISNTTFKNNVAGVGVTAAINGGAFYATDLTSITIKDNSLFEDNFAQSNAGAFYVLKSDLTIKDTIFRHNMSGNDGSAIDLQSKVDGHTILIEDTIFEKNIGFATNGQSMGTVWLEQWNSPKTNPIVFRNVVFRENIARTGGAIADNSNGGKGVTNVYLENIEIYENEVGSGALAYIQGADYIATNVNVHDNNVTNGASIYVANEVNVVIEDSIITNNTGSSSGIGVYVIAGDVTIRNTEISNNTSTGARGAGIFVRGYYTGSNPSLTLENTTIKNNTAATTGGGVAVADNADVFSQITIDDTCKIYDNTAGQAGDDFSYVRANNSENATDNTITLDNISIAGIIGIDGWYQDNSGDRFKDTENPTVFTAYVNNDGTIDFFLKAAGVSSVSYDGNGGETNALPVDFKYGDTFVVDDDVPTKEGYTFEEWNTKPDGTGTSLKAGDVYDGSEGYVLYAILTPNQYTITFDTKGGTKIDPITQDYGTDVEAPDNPKKRGYTFKGWDIDIPETMPAEDLVITAKWKAIAASSGSSNNTGSSKDPKVPVEPIIPEEPEEIVEQDEEKPDEVINPTSGEVEEEIPIEDENIIEEDIQVQSEPEEVPTEQEPQEELNTPIEPEIETLPTPPSNETIQNNNSGNPQTDDRLVYNVAMLLLSLMGVLGGIVYFKRK